MTLSTPDAGPEGGGADTREPRGRGATLAAVARLLAGGADTPGEHRPISTGEHAALRRMDPSSIGPAAFAFERLWVQAGAPESDPERWALIVHALALARGRHDPRRPTGAALQEVGLTEQRLNLLLAADLEVLFDLLPRLARRLDARAAALDWLPLADIVLNAGRNEVEADRARLRIARAYARASAAKPPNT